MGLFLKNVSRIGRSMYLYYPAVPMDSPWKISCITVLREESDEASVKKLLDAGLAELSERERIIVSFPNPTAEGWHTVPGGAWEQEKKELLVLQDEVTKPEDGPGPVNSQGIPTLAAMLGAYRPRHDAKYWIGFGKGADMMYSLAGTEPEKAAAVFGLGGDVSPETAALFADAPVSAWLSGASPRAAECFRRMNHTDRVREEKNYTYCDNSVNPAQFVITEPAAEFNAFTLNRVYEALFARVRRLVTGARGDMEFRTDRKSRNLYMYQDERCLDGKPHTFIVCLPEKVRRDPFSKVPMMLYMHGGGESCSEAAEMSKFHDLGEKEGFITVYPLGSNRCSWNMELTEDGEDDEAFLLKLTDFMCDFYPVDPQRIYLSGFSNGAGMAQTLAMTHPEKYAALCHIDSNWPGRRIGYSEVDYEKVKPTAIGLAKKKDFDYRMPVWYTYGTKEPSCPVYRGCTQQHQYDFWKIFNNIEVKETADRERAAECPSGVKGDRVEILTPSAQYPGHRYEVNRFFTSDPEPENYYNFVLMHDKGHEVAPMDPALAWNYVKQFKRNPDGTVGRTDR